MRVLPLVGRVALVLAWFDCWIGMYWSREQRRLYVFPLPMVGLRIDCRKV